MKAFRLLRGTTLAGLCLLISGCVGLLATPSANSAPLSYAIVDTGQSACYNNSAQVACPQVGQSFYGQDAQTDGNAPRYLDNGDGTVTDLVTGLMWRQAVTDKMTHAQALAGAGGFNLAGYADWRLPTIKELYSLILFNGLDVGPESGSGSTPFIDTAYFDFEYGDTSAGERIIDAQYVSSTAYAANGLHRSGEPFGNLVFGVNFADGRIKGYPGDATGPGGAKTFFVRYVRGNQGYGQNDFIDNGDGTVTDLATGLTWSWNDSGVGMNWEEALAYVQSLNDQNYLGHADWRLPNAKELQSIVDYGRSPDTTDSAAIHPAFNATAITNEAGQRDWGFYWASTTHASVRSGQEAVYVAFGRALGYMNGRWQDVHGAGAQRSDPKTGSAGQYPTGHGPQGDAVRVDNFVRVVRGM